MVVGSVEVIGAGLVLVHITPVIAPPGRFGQHARFDFPGPIHPPRGAVFGRQSTVIKQVLVHAVCKRQPILGTIDQVGVQASRHVGVGYAIVVDVHHQLFPIPRHELELAIRATAPDCIPVVVEAPVTIGAVEIQDRVINEVGHVQQLLDAVVIGELAHVRIPAHADHGVISGQVTVDGLQRFGGDGVVLVPGAAQVIGRKIRIDPFPKVVHTPVKPVDVEVEVPGVAR
jgi:hypothetical protein